MSEARGTVVLEVASADGGSYVVTKTDSADGYRDGTPAALELRLVANARGQAWRNGRVGAIAGALAPMLILPIAAYTLLPPDHVGGDHLTPTRGDAGACWASSLCFVPFTALLGYLIGKYVRALPPPTYRATFGKDVEINGRSLGALVRVDSDVVTRRVLIVTTEVETHLTLQSPNDAVALAEVLSNAVPTRGAT